MPAKPMELIFPLKGVDDGWGFGNQPEGTCPDALNVVPVDTLDSRIRGGQRWGTTKYFAALHNGANAIQRLGSISTVTSATRDFTETFAKNDGAFWSSYPNKYDHFVSDFKWTGGGSSVFASRIDADTAETIQIVSNKLKIETAAAEYSSAHIYTGQNYTFTGDYSIAFDIKCTGAWPPATRSYFVVLFRVNPAYNNEFYGVRFDTVIWEDTAGFTARLIKGNGTDYDTLETETALGGYTAAERTALMAGITITISITSAGSVTIDWGDIAGATDDTFTETLDSYGDHHGVGFGFFIDNSANDTIYFDNFAVSGMDVSESGRIFDLLAVSGGDVYAGKTNGLLDLATNGENAVATSGRIDMQAAFKKVYFVDGDPANYSIWTQATDTVSTWAPTGGTLPMGTDQTAVDITAATPGTPSFTIAEDWSGRAAGDYLLVAGSTGNDGFYTIASIAGTGPTVLTVNEAVADDTADGTIQYQNKACTIIKLYRGRLVLAGLETDPQNWFMTAADNLLDFDYGATPSAVMAVAGNNTDAGYCPDIITCLAPYSDDLMFIGGDHSLWLMRGDPAHDGRIDNVSYQTGISGPDAYTFDPNGIFYFFGQGTLWRMSAGGVPEPLSRNRMDVAFNAIDLTVNTVHLAWDNIQHGLYIFVRPSISGTTTHYYWDERTDGFWPISFPNDQGPTTAYAFDGDDPNDNALLLGGWDGYIRYIDSSVKNDDGVKISSSVLYPPIMAGGPLNNMRINGLTAIVDASADGVTLTAYAEDTPQGVVESATIRYARVLSAGRNRVLNRVAGNAVMFKLSNSTISETWAIENIVADVEVVGRTRKNQL